MATFDHFGNMYDVALKPHLLRTLISDHLQLPFSNTSKLSKVVSLIKTHSLLSESVIESMHPKLIEAWNSAVDSWVDTILLLLSSNTSVERWAGISLLGFTCEECSSVRFLGSSRVWFKELLKFLQPEEPESQADSHLLRVAACASISDLFARLSGFPKSKKEWSSDAVKVVEPVLSMLRADNSEPTWKVAVHLLCTMITSLQSSINRHFESHYESQIGTKVAELCAHALLTLEVLIHPRALPLVDYACTNNSTFGEAQCNFRDDYVSRNNTGLPQAVPPLDYDDNFDVRWFGNGDEVVGSLTKNAKYTKVPPSNTIQERSEMVSETATCADVEMRIVEDDINFKSDEPRESVVQFQEPVSCIPVSDTGGEIEPERIVSDSTVPHMESGQGSMIVRSNSSSLQRTSDSNMVQEFASKLNYGLSMVDEDAFPDIVDVDPDSDFDSE